MYYVQFKVDGEQWVNDLKCGSLDEALSYAVPEARTTMVLYHRVIKIKKKGKVKVLAKFKPLSSHQLG
jgi:hypothetical protein